MKILEVSEAYNETFANLEEARSLFEKDSKMFIKKIEADLEQFLENSAIANEQLRLEISECEKSKSGYAARNFSCSTKLNIHVKWPGKQRFQNDVFSLVFEISFSEVASKFFLNCILNMKEDVEIDLFGVVRDKLLHMKAEEPFGHRKPISSKSYLCFRSNVNQDSFEKSSKWVATVCHALLSTLHEIVPKPTVFTSPGVVLPGSGEGTQAA